jgi:hypothetical protein
MRPEKDLNLKTCEQKISQLENLKETLFKDLPPGDRELKEQLDLMLRAVRLECDKLQATRVEWLKKQLEEKWLARVLAIYGAILSVALPTWLLIFWLKPLWLHGLNESLSGLDMRIPYLDRPVGLRQVLLLSPFHYCHRVLDAWVRAYLGQARASFATLDTVKARAMHVPVPITLNGLTVAQPSPQDFQEVFRKTPFCLLIWGEGGSGKTSLACQLAGWALAADPASSPVKHPMLPVLLEHDLKIELESGGPPLLEAIHKHVVERVTGRGKIAPELLHHLLRRQRLLVIVDHFSELSQETRQVIHPGYHHQLTINAMIVTSRQEEKFQGSVTDTLKPLRIRGNRLSSFLEAYLTQLGKRELYYDADFFAACGRLTQMVGDRNLTVMLARMFADQMVATKEDPNFEGLPDNIPELILSYLNWINRQESEKNPGNKAVQRIAKVVSWVSLAPTFRPQDASLAAIRIALADEADLDQKLAYLCRDLEIIQYVGPAEDRVRVTLDPVSEYLAGLRLLELYGANEVQWKAFLKEADKKEGAPKAIEGFLLAVRDCCLAKGKDKGVPGFVEKELAQKTSITKETAKEEAE